MHSGDVGSDGGKVLQLVWGYGFAEGVDVCICVCGLCSGCAVRLWSQTRLQRESLRKSTIVSHSLSVGVWGRGGDGVWVLCRLLVDLWL